MRAERGSVSLVIRCFNEQEHIGALLESLQHQTLRPREIIIVDSGSTDGTLGVVSRFPCLVVHIAPDEFTFGRSLNHGCRAASGDILAFASAHVLPINARWLEELVEPFVTPEVALVYGRQIGNAATRFSEHQVFLKHFPEQSDPDQQGPFCNNANAAIRRTLWERHPYDESLTGLEDLAWGKWARSEGYRLVYRAEAGIIHIHDETAAQIQRRYRREAIALRRIFPDSHMSLLEMFRFLFHSIVVDLRAAWRAQRLLWVLGDILAFRCMQYVGTYGGLHQRSPMTHEMLMRYYYPAHRPIPPRPDGTESQRK